MAPKRARKPVKKDEDDLDEDELDYELEADIDEEDEDSDAKPKKGAKKRTPAKKRKPKAEQEDPEAKLTEEKRTHAKKRKPKEEEEEDPEAKLTEEKPKRKKTPAKPKRTEPYTSEDGWSVIPPGLLVKSTDTSGPNQRIAAFDLDDTLVVLKSSNAPQRGPTSAEDYRMFNKTVIQKVKDLQEEGYKLVIFSNQGTIKSALDGVAAEKLKARAINIVQELDVPITVMYATGKDDGYRKPATGMWQHFVTEFCGGQDPDLKASFFVGDAAGRPTDFAASDKEFAEAIGLPFKLPEEQFGEGDAKKRAANAQKGDGPGDGPNADMANAFLELVKVQENAGANPFGISATRKSAAIIAGWPTKITSGKELASTQGIGKGSVQKINEFLESGTLAQLEEAGVKPTRVSTKEAAAKEATDSAFQFA